MLFLNIPMLMEKFYRFPGGIQHHCFGESNAVSQIDQFLFIKTVEALAAANSLRLLAIRWDLHLPTFS